MVAGSAFVSPPVWPHRERVHVVCVTGNSLRFSSPSAAPSWLFCKSTGAASWAELHTQRLFEEIQISQGVTFLQRRHDVAVWLSHTRVHVTKSRSGSFRTRWQSGQSQSAGKLERINKMVENKDSIKSLNMSGNPSTLLCFSTPQPSNFSVFLRWIETADKS